MGVRTDTFDLGALRLTSGEGRRLDLEVTLEPLELGADHYTVTGPAGAVAIPVRLDISRMTGSGYALHVAFAATLHGPCMRCLEPAEPVFDVDAREVHQPGDGDDLESPYVIESMLDLAAWARDSLVLALPPAILCTPDCLGLCPVCGANLNEAGPEHAHEPAIDPRWAALAELEFAPADGADAPAEAEPDAAPDPTDPA